MKHPVEKERGRKYVGLPEFAQTAERILSELQLEQERGTVTNVPDERTIRYYLSEGLIQPPEEKQGTASVFGYRNLLQLVTIKRLQADHLPIRKIRELVAGKSEQELESLLGIGGPAGKKQRENEAKRYLESLLAPPMFQTFGSVGATGISSPSQLAAPKAAAPAQEADQTPSWQRLEIEPGLELHIRSDYTPPTTSARTRSLGERVIRGLRSAAERQPKT
ncbi:MAG TPA: MerR family transcriptional regulator [Pyrinomonadaceae bacterium]|nr:MerR family transcriptional regulator [Pyrinomonadaceae bacterium]